MQRDGINWFFLLCLVIPNLLFMGYWAWGMRIEVIKEIETRVSSDLVFTVISCMKRERFRERYLKKEDMGTKQKSNIEVLGSGGP